MQSFEPVIDFESFQVLVYCEIMLSFIAIFISFIIEHHLIPSVIFQVFFHLFHI